MRLAEGMTLKAAAAGLDLGGGKAVIIGDPARLKSPWLLRAFAKAVARFDGAYYTSEDVGTTVEDMELLRSYTPYVVGLREGRLGGGGDPSPFTSGGVLAAMRGAWEEETGSPSLEGVRVVVIGVGKVGGGLARRLVAEGAQVLVTDVDHARAAALGMEIGSTVLDPEGAAFVPCERKAKHSGVEAQRFYANAADATSCCFFPVGKGAASVAEVLLLKGPEIEAVAMVHDDVRRKAVHRGLAADDLLGHPGYYPTSRVSVFSRNTC